MFKNILRTCPISHSLINNFYNEIKKKKISIVTPFNCLEIEIANFEILKPLKSMTISFLCLTFFYSPLGPGLTGNHIHISQPISTNSFIIILR